MTATSAHRRSGVIGLPAIAIVAGGRGPAPPPAGGGARAAAPAPAAPPGPRQTEQDEYTRYELLAPDTASFKIDYEVTATTPGARAFWNPIRKGSVASDERSEEHTSELQ